MRMKELSDRSGVPTATIKYYLREGLLRPGRRINATQAAYDEEHLRRLRLVRALIQVGRMPVATAREVLVAVEDDALDLHSRIGAAVWSLPADFPDTGAKTPGTAPPPDAEAPVPDAAPDPVVAAAEERATELLVRLGWSFGSAARGESPAYRTLVEAIAALERSGYPCAMEDLLAYGRCADQLGVVDIDMIEAYEPGTRMVEAAVASTVLYEPVLLSLRRLAQAEESNRRFGDGG
ncbi:MerR family transcriptional regulator [Streptomyces sp. NPDC093085]|uniref:MerR family transcriptional regulator n=1 Tax=Streptomyces sp. NPDC093085 TaxID=3155068 RepID=UPI003435E2E7